MENDLKIVPYNSTLTKNYRYHNNLERTQGRDAMTYLMKYTFKLPEAQEVMHYISGENESAAATQPKLVQNKIRAYMRARLVDAVSAA